MMTVILRKELKMLFISPIAWILLTLSQLIFTWAFLGRLDAFLEIQPQLLQLANPPGATEVIVSPLFALAAIVLLMITPILAMRLLAEERRQHTLQLLLSAPVSITDIVIGKFLGLLLFFLIIIVSMIVLCLSLLLGGTLDFGLLASNVLGLMLIAACFAAIGLYLSSLTAQPVVAALGALGVLLSFWIIDFAADETQAWLHHISLLKHFERFNQGLIDTFSIAYFILLMTACLAFTIHRLNAERLPH
ncbi:ABC transporter permease [Nitrosomonas sp. JL21]|uniref:ABC transporter permease subunit n=1 Tax=Nitrosomonas sp. JL21 TaxID=153949 RepID=UPI00136DDA2D|nr:ABC transporter permease subunit [Nitrosomonas sp. JL21]MBL8497988.1 ABC transporter permease subunit [Nitrosomonas sp.]MCC7092338.1 ABC transporter permease subunit [Nitrosomonas sp.]MXS78772.1 ABC transporter permease [Nitrosomonas sp. JL21]